MITYNLNKKIMKNFLTLVALCFTIILNAQWIKDTSCDKQAGIVASQAIEYALNLEYLAAFGAANSALLLDEDCGCAKLTLAFISSSNPNWGSRAKKLKEINASKLTSEEKAWHDHMLATLGNRTPLEKSIANKFTKSPLLNYMATSMKDFNSFKDFAEKFPAYASSAYNMISYGYMNGAFSEENVTEAIKYIKMSQSMHDGPNAHDSMAEHYASVGDYENALKSQRKAIDFGTFSSPYIKYAQIYYAKTVASDISEEIIAIQKAMQKTIMTNDYEAYKKFEHPEITVTQGDSNLDPFYVFTKKEITQSTSITWDVFEFSNMKTYFSPDMKTAVVLFEADGEYIVTETNETISYATRGSSTWINTSDGWKILHSTYAPRKGKTGIPEKD
tara:strand:+ start:852 stop:2018 length:1167 start_codon:yes stop_codon:yes gene_type:complete